MINIRYHIVSITAVFLALGIGVALGSTFLDGATVDVLNNNISSAENRIRESNEKIDGLEEDRDAAAARDTGLILLGTDRLLGDTLTDQPVLIVAEPGMSDDELAALVNVLDRSGADLRGTLTLSDRLSLSAERDGDLAQDLGLADGASAQEIRDEVTSQLTVALAAAGTPAPEEESEEDPTTTTTTAPGATTTTQAGATTTTTEPGADGESDDQTDDAPDGSQPSIVTTLVDRGYADLKPGPDRSEGDPILESVGYRYVFAGSAEPRREDSEVLLRFLPGTGAVPAVVVAGTPPRAEGDEEQAVTIVAQVRASEELAVSYSTVDDLDTFAGLAATVFSLADLGAAPVGHYGQAEGATALLPPLP